MRYFVKAHFATLLLLLTAISNAYCDFGNPSLCEENKDCFSYQSCCGKGFIGADFLFWRAFEGGLDECIPNEVVDVVLPDGRVFSGFRGKNRDTHFRWNPGVRIAAGYQPAYSNWGIAATWTHLHSHSHGSNSWKINFDTLDVVAGYNFNSDYCSSLMPFFGLRGAKIDQKLRFNEFFTSFTTNNRKEEFYGIGPLIGIEAKWEIGCGFKLFATASVSWLYGNYNVRLDETNETFDSLVVCQVRKHLDAIQPIGDAAIGIRWQTCFCSKIVMLQLAVEHHHYFNHNRIGSYGDLSFDGLTLSTGVEF